MEKYKYYKYKLKNKIINDILQKGGETEFLKGYYSTNLLTKEPKISRDSFNYIIDNILTPNIDNFKTIIGKHIIIIDSLNISMMNPSDMLLKELIEYIKNNYDDIKTKATDRKIPLFLIDDFITQLYSRIPNYPSVKSCYECTIENTTISNCKKIQKPFPKKNNIFCNKQNDDINLEDKYINKYETVKLSSKNAWLNKYYEHYEILPPEITKEQLDKIFKIHLGGGYIQYPNNKLELISIIYCIIMNMYLEYKSENYNDYNFIIVHRYEKEINLFRNIPMYNNINVIYVNEKINREADDLTVILLAELLKIIKNDYFIYILTQDNYIWMKNFNNNVLIKQNILHCKDNIKILIEIMKGK
jgi:hypothetical protein